MQSNILQTKIAICIAIIALLISGCYSKTDLKNQITIKIKSVDSETKQPRINAFDSIEVRKEGFGYLKKTFKIVGKYMVDSTGSVNIEIDGTKIYQITLYGVDVFGAEYFAAGELKDGQEVNIEVIHPE